MNSAIDERLLKLGMIWQWKANKGSPYAEDMGTYSDALVMICRSRQAGANHYWNRRKDGGKCQCPPVAGTSAFRRSMSPCKARRDRRDSLGPQARPAGMISLVRWSLYRRWCGWHYDYLDGAAPS